jgi:hypothetical protein
MGSKGFWWPLRAAMASVVIAGSLTGCNSGGEEIPLAKVPPPPEGFGKVQPGTKVPKSASPNNANEMRR